MGKDITQKKEKKWSMAGLIGIILSMAVIICCMEPVMVSAADDTVKVSWFDKKLKKYAVSTESFIKEDDAFAASDVLTNEVAAVLLNRADEYVNGDKYNTTMLERIQDKQRISDISKAKKEYRLDIYKTFMKGLMVGYSNGTYSQDRSFRPKNKMTKSEATAAIKRFQSKGKRISLSPDGQVIRTTNLPKNYKKFPYILASFPNSFYEKKLNYQYTISKGGIPTSEKPLVSRVDYIDPVDMDEYCILGYDKYTYSFETSRMLYEDQWVDCVKKNLQYRFNYSYKNTDYKKWCKGLMDTCYTSNGKSYWTDDLQKWMDAYRKWTAEDHVTVQSSKIVVEPSTIYDDRGIYIRAYIRFKVTTDKMYTAESWDQNGLIWGPGTQSVYFPGLKNNKWYTAVIDVPLHGDARSGSDMKVNVQWQTLGMW